MTDNFQTAWQQFHPNSQPVSHLVRDSESANWLRFHSLPESKRYAENEDDVAIILSRQNVIADAVIGNGNACWMVSYLYVYDEDNDSDHFWRENHERLFEKYALTPVFRIHVPEDECHFDIFARKTVWQAGTFDEALRDIADDKVRAFWMSDAEGAIFAPYDGGTDLIIPEPLNITNLSLKFSDWLSSYPGGY